jgi:hypothetical protein
MSDTIHALRRETDEARALLANLHDIIADEEQMAADMVEGETSLHEAMAQAVQRILDLDALIQGVTAAAITLGIRKSRLDKQRDNIRTALCAAMDAANVKKLELPIATVSLRAVPPKAEIIDEAAIPAKFWKPQDPKLDKKAVLDALKAKEAVSGATLSNGGLTISVKGA